ncbi:hypothetical protein E4U19_000409 [Claviceps sp. Clav32 group G5]|nr:hypothetical protein E4U19_000409 [Claviceps sp. Clav32 group G5]
MDSPASDSMYAMQDVPGKGRGLVATRNIPQGTRIISEQALFTVRNVVNVEERQRLVCQQVDLLSNDQRDAFLSMHNAHTFNDTARRYLGIFQTNSLPAGEISTSNNRGIYLQACHLNHDCDYNATYDWNVTIQRLTVHAFRDIDAGEEITVPYVEFLMNHESRRKIFKVAWDFTCSCRLCSLPRKLRQERDRKLEKIVRLGELCKSTSRQSPIQTLRYCHAQMCLYSELGRGDCDFAQVYEFAANLTIAHGDLARARVFAEKTATVWTTVYGSDSQRVIHYTDLARFVMLRPLYGFFSMAWKTDLGDVPQGIGPDDFENWLWKRETPTGLTRLTIPPGSQANFCGYVDLPYTRGIGKGGSSKKRQWCFLGEIVDIGFFGRLKFEIKDMRGRKVPLFFYTKGGGRELMRTQYKTGYTVAVLDALQHLFQFSPPGIRHEDPRMMKIFPLSLSRMLELNSQFRKFAVRHQNDMRMCHGCGTNATARSMKRCGMCLSFWYCNKECQMAGWTAKAHKGDCKFLRDPDLRGLFLIKWDEVQDCVRFPLRVADDSI